MSIEFGVDYYPEHWDRSRWETDARLMAEMGIDVVRMGEFSWFKFERKPGEYDFSWLDEAIALLGRRGIKTIVGTPTAAPPRWLVDLEPSILPVDTQGITRGFGGRHHACHSNAVYRERSRLIVAAMAEHYRDNAEVVGWQIDNELGNSHDNLCTCDSCRASFQAWLERRYGDIARLNEAWGTSFWSQDYSSFSQIPSPRVTPNSHNPSLLLDWKRFCSDLIADFARMQIDIIRGQCPGQFVTHNMMGYAEKVNYFDLSEGLDFASQDQYPMGYWMSEEEKSPSSLASALDLIRGVKHRNFWVMEQQAGPAAWETFGRTPRPGQLGLWTAQSVAHGADAVVFFRWRTCTFGTEEFWHGILPHSGIPGRRYEELSRTIARLKPIMQDTKGLYADGEAGILYDYDQCWALRIQPQNPKLGYPAAVRGYYAALHRRNLGVDFLGPKSELGGYKAIVAPLLFVLGRGMEEKLRRYVAEGGVLVTTMRSGVKTETNTCRTDGSLPCGLVDVLGIEVLDYDCLGEVELPVAWAGEIAPSDDDRGAWWCDSVTPMEGTRVLATFSGGLCRGEPAVTFHRFGKGAAYYVATQPSASLMQRIMDHLAATAGIAGIVETEKGVEAAFRTGRSADYLFVMNHDEAPHEIRVPAPWAVADAGEGPPGGPLGAYETRIYRRAK
jgi:beta-galactosidase